MADHLKYDSTTGHLVYETDGHLVHSCAPEPPSCDGTDTNDYRIVGYDNDDFPSCCGGGGEPNTVDWDGIFYHVSNCRWEGGGTSYWVGYCAFQAYSGNPQGRAQMGAPSLNTITYNSLYGRWTLSWSSLNQYGNYGTMWTGRKTTGSTPAGVYSRTGGCANTVSAITVEAI